MAQIAAIIKKRKRGVSNFRAKSGCKTAMYFSKETQTKMPIPVQGTRWRTKAYNLQSISPEGVKFDGNKSGTKNQPKGQCPLNLPNKWIIFWRMQKMATSKSARAKLARKKLVAVRIERWAQITKIVNKLPNKERRQINWKRKNGKAKFNVSWLFFWSNLLNEAINIRLKAMPFESPKIPL
jgi:hypothetical protein